MPTKFSFPHSVSALRAGLGAVPAALGAEADGHGVDGVAPLAAPGRLRRGGFDLRARLHGDERLQKGVRAWPALLAVRGQGLREGLAQGGRDVLLAEIAGILAGDGEVENAAETVDVGPLVRDAGVRLLLGGAVAEREELLAGDRELARVGGLEVGEAEIDDLGLARLVEEDVRGLEVAVDDPVCMGIRDRLGDFDEQVDGLVDGVLPVFGDLAVERDGGVRKGRVARKLTASGGRRGAGHILHRDVGAVGVLA